MNTHQETVRDHYHRPRLFENILERLRELGISEDSVSRKDISAVDEFHVRGAEVSLELARLLPMQGAKVLDVGCGIGGPARMLADEMNCEVTGIDLNPEFVRTAGKLSELIGLQDKVNFITGDALQLPFEDQSFEVVWTQHVQMNIEDKTRFYSEINRVLNNGGTFIYYDIFKLGSKPIDYPVPWADTDRISFLFPVTDLAPLLSGLGLQQIRTTDQTAKGIAFFNRLFERVRQQGSPKLGVNALMKGSAPQKLGNLLAALKDGRLQLQSGVYRKFSI